MESGAPSSSRKRSAPVESAAADVTMEATAAAVAAQEQMEAATAAAVAAGDSALRPMSTSGTPSSVEPPPSKKPTLETGTSSRTSPNTTSGKPYKGLRHFSMMVCKKVEEKGVTTYNEVADELVQHVVAERRKEDPNSKFDEKNIRRRVYDALNVLMAMDIITKEKKAISWKGLPTSAHADLDMLQREKEYRQAEITRKREGLKELLIQQVCFRNLVDRNHHFRQQQTSSQQSQTQTDENKDHKIPLPFIVVNTHSSAVIQCNMSRDLTDVMFDFSQPFEINDDNTILKRLGMHKASSKTLQAMLPEDLYAYAQRHRMLDGIVEEIHTGNREMERSSSSSPTISTGRVEHYERAFLP